MFQNASAYNFLFQKKLKSYCENRIPQYMWKCFAITCYIIWSLVNYSSQHLLKSVNSKEKQDYLYNQLWGLICSWVLHFRDKMKQTQSETAKLSQRATYSNAILHSTSDSQSLTLFHFFVFHCILYASLILLPLSHLQWFLSFPARDVLLKSVLHIYLSTISMTLTHVSRLSSLSAFQLEEPVSQLHITVYSNQIYLHRNATPSLMLNSNRFPNLQLSIIKDNR